MNYNMPEGYKLGLPKGRILLWLMNLMKVISGV